MPVISKLSPEGWAELRKASEMGVDDRTLEQDYGVSRDSIRLRRSREKWLSRERLEQAISARRERLIDTEGHKLVTADSVIVQSMAERAEAHTLSVFNHTTKALQAALPKLPTPKDWKTAAIVDQMARRAAGLDRPDVANVSVKIEGWQASVTAQSGTSGFVDVEGEVVEGSQQAEDEQ